MQIAAVATEAPSSEVGRFQRADLEQLGLLVKAVLEDLLNGAVARRAEVQRPATGGFKPKSTCALSAGEKLNITVGCGTAHSS